MTGGVKSGKAQNEQMFSRLPPKADLPPDLRTTPAASSSRMPPSRPRASARSRASACGPHDVQRGHVSLLVPNLPRHVARRRSPTRGIQGPSETLPRRRRRSNRPCAVAALASSRPAARRRARSGRARADCRRWSAARHDPAAAGRRT